MKQVLLFACLLFAICAQAQNVKLEYIVRPGTKLIYAVDAGGKKYDFIVTVNDLKGNSFSWEMTDPVNISGKITQTAKALASANTMYNFFQAGDKKLDDKTLSVWISQKCFNQFDKHASQPMKMFLNGPDKEAENVGTYTGDLALEITVDGKIDTVYEELVVPLTLAGSNYVPADDNNDFFTVYNSAAFPIILRMNLGFSIALKEIKTH